MSIPIIHHVRGKSQSKSSARTLPLNLAIYANDCCGVAWPADASLYHDVHVSRQRIHELKRQLVAAQELVITKRPGATNLYYIAWKGVPLGSQGDYAGNRRGQHEPECPALETRRDAGPSLRARRRLCQRRRDRSALALIARDGYRCRSLGCTIREDLVIDHIAPLFKRGPDTLENLQWLCRPHNHVKAARTEEVPHAL
jgi:hypothetical protein